jgi:hypothetical protein
MNTIIIFGIIFLTFVLMVDWRLNQICKELQKLNAVLERSGGRVPPADR